MKQDFETEPPRVDTNISPPVKALLDRVFDSYSVQFPTLVMLASGTISNDVENLSDASLKDWAEQLDSHSASIARLAGQLQSLTLMDRAVVAEIQRFLSQQLLINNQQRMFATRAASSYRLICFALLPYYLLNQKDNGDHPQSPEMLKLKLSRCIGLLDLMMNRVDQGITSHTQKDCQMASIIAMSIQKWTALPDDLANALVNRLQRLARIEAKGTPLEVVGMDIYLQEILGITAKPSQIVQTLLPVIEEELLHLSEELKSAERPILLCPHDQIFDMVFALVSDKTEGIFLDAVGAKPPCSVAPELIRPFVPDALYLPSHGESDVEDQSGTLLVNPIYLNPDTMSPASMALVVAHEIVPGHREQHRRWARLPFSKLFGMTHSLLGFEGWATYAESAVLGLTGQLDGVQPAFKFQRVRRLATVLLGLTNGRAESVVHKLLSNLPVPVRDEVLGLAKQMRGAVHQMLPYTWGLYETKATISFAKNAYTLSNAKAHELYLTLGPLHPQSIKAILKA